MSSLSDRKLQGQGEEVKVCVASFVLYLLHDVERSCTLLSYSLNFHTTLQYFLYKYTQYFLYKYTLYISRFNHIYMESCNNQAFESCGRKTRNVLKSNHHQRHHKISPIFTNIICINFLTTLHIFFHPWSITFSHFILTLTS